MFRLATLASAAGLAAAAASAATVTVAGGVVNGVEGALANQYLGIPFGSVPGRWQDATAAPAWSDPLDASAPGASCPQTCVDGLTLPPDRCPSEIAEDCLFLNVFQPQGGATDLPVMVYIYGGDFMFGSNSDFMFDASAMANATGTITVVPNYRLNSLGFAYDSDVDTMTGNFGLHDQQLALQWVQDNIEAFGGSPDRVTLFGQSAGAMSVAAHMVMDASDGLFQQAIMESEPFSLPWRDPDEWSDFALLVAKKAGCTKGVTGHKRMDLACMEALPLDDLLDAEQAARYDIPAELANVLEIFLPFSPVIGVPELPLHPRDVFQAGGNQDKPFMIGTNAQEGIEFLYAAFANPIAPVEVKLGFDIIFGEDDAAKILEFYPMPEGETDMRAYMGDVTTDALFDCPTRNVTLLAKQSAPVFRYHMDHPMSFGAEAWGSNFEECWNATCHSGELPFLWQPEQAAAHGWTYTDAEQALSSEFMLHWASFAATGAPQASWPAFDAESLQTLMFETPATAVETNANSAACDFWDELGYFWNGS